MAAPAAPLRGPLLFVSYAYPPDLGGTERQSEALALRLRERGCEVSVIARAGAAPPGQEVRRGVPVRRVRSIRAPGLEWPTFALAAAAAGLRGPRPAVVHSFILSAPAWAGAAVAFLRGAACVCKPSAAGAGGNLDRLRRSFYGRLWGRFLLRRTDAFVCVNEEIAAELEGAGVPPACLRLIPNGVDTARFAPAPEAERAALRERLGFAGRVVALYAGRLEPVKGIEDLLEMWERLAARHSDALLALVGDGVLRGRVEDASRRLPGLRLYPATERVEELYRAADLFVLPSVREGLSNALLEAMACGLPAVARDLPGNAAAVRHGADGLLARDAPAIERSLASLLADGGERRRLGEEAARGVRRRFSIDAVADAHLDLYRALAGRNRRRHIPVLAYHRVVERPEYGMDVARGEFESQMAWLARRGYRTLLPADLAALLERDEEFPPDGVVLTFDDGHRDNLSVALPVLERHGFRACVFLTAGFLGTTRWSVAAGGERGRVWHAQEPAGWRDLQARGVAAGETHRRYEFLSWQECERLREAGWEFGAHTLTHPFLTALPEEEARREIVEGRRLIEERLGVRVACFCYPSGDVDARVRALAAAAGFRLAFATPSHAHLGGPHADPLRFERIGVFGSVGAAKFRMLVRGRYQVWRRRLPGWAWTALTGIRRALGRPAGSERAAHA